MGKRVYLRSLLQEGDAAIDPEECLSQLHKDYRLDCGDDGELDYDQFCRAWFELAGGTSFW